MRDGPGPAALPAWFSRGASGLLARLRADGGFTVDPRTGAVPTSGFAVNTGTGALVVPASQLDHPGGPEVLADFVRSRPDLLAPRSALLLGGWYHRPSDRVVLSCVDRVDDRDRALALGAARRQTDVYDLAGARLLPTGFVR